MDRFGEKLHNLRIKHNLSVRQLASDLGISSSSYISRLEKSQKNPSAKLVLKISRYFDISADLLLRDELDLD